MGVYGAADSTLVNMSYRAAMANVPLDQTAIFAQRQKNLTDFTSAVSKLFENQWQDHKATEKNRMSIAQTTEDILLSGGNINDYQLDNHTLTVENFKVELDNIKNDPMLSPQEKQRARKKLDLKMHRYKNEITEQKVLFDEMVNYSANGYVYTTPGSPEAKTWNAILSDYNNNTNTAKQSVENGEIFYTFEGNKMSLRDIKKGLSKHDSEFQANFQKKINDYVAQLKSFQQQGLDMSPVQFNKIKEDLNKNIINMDQARNVANMKDPNTGFSFNEVLYGQAKVMGVNGHEMIDNTAIEIIHKELDKLSTKYGHGTAGNDGNSPIDMNNDGFYDATDMKMYHDPANAELLIKKIEEDPELYKELVVNYHMESNVKKVYANSMMESLEAHRLEMEKTKAELDKDYQKKLNTQKAAAAYAKPSDSDIKKEKERKKLNNVIDEAISTSNFSALSGLKKGFRMSDDKTKLYYVQDGKPMKNPQNQYYTIDITGKDLKTDKDIQNQIKSYIFGNVNYDPYDPYDPN